MREGTLKKREGSRKCLDITFVTGPVFYIVLFYSYTAVAWPAIPINFPMKRILNFPFAGKL